MSHKDEVLKYAIRVVDAEMKRIDDSNVFVRFNCFNLRFMLAELRTVLTAPPEIRPEDFIIPSYFQPEVTVTEDMTGDSIPLPKRFKGKSRGR